MRRILLLFALICHAGAAAAQSAAPEPVEISASKSLEWNRKARTYTARGDVVVTQGARKLGSDILIARYTDKDGAADISSLEAEGNVVIRSDPYTATGDKAVYDVKTGAAVMTGQDLRIMTAEEVLTARDEITFSGTANTLTAKGAATAVRGTDELSADTLGAIFSRNAQGEMTAQKITARGHVTLKTAKETATGDEGVYDIPAQKAALTGRVRILQGKNWLEGTRADVDMKTGISRLSGTGNPATEGRVKGVFFPKPRAEKQEEPKE